MATPLLCELPKELYAIAYDGGGVSATEKVEHLLQIGETLTVGVYQLVETRKLEAGFREVGRACFGPDYHESEASG